MAVALASGGAFGALSDYYVSPGATGDGSSAATPCSMATAFNAVKSDQSGSTITIHFLDGTYNKESHGIAGGFARNGTTIVRGASGDATKVIWIPPANSRITVAQVPTSGANHLVFEDLTFQDCHPNNYQGGAFHNQINSSANGELTVRRCRFINCDTLVSSANQHGGAVKLAYGFLYDCYFENCISKGNGGAVYQGDAEGSVISNCTFVSCTGGIGGGIFAMKSNTKVVDCVLSNCLSTSTYWRSGGAFVQNGVQIHGTSFIDCRADGQRASSGDGAGGVTMTSGCMVSNCVFRGCSSTDRNGGVYAEGGNTKIMDCWLENCSASIAGGAANSKGGLVSGCTFTNCVTTANKGGGLLVTQGGIVSNCSFYACQSAGYGGAAFFERSYGYDLTAVGNRTTNGSGGAFGIDNTPLLNCTIKDNSATTEAGGIFTINNSVISNCVISGNVAPRGGGIHFYANVATNVLTDAHLKVIDCLIVGNTACIPAGGTGCGQGGGISFQGFMTVDGCTIASNQTYSMDTQYAKSGGGIWCRYADSTPIRLLNSELDGNVGWARTNTVNSANPQQRHDGTYGGNFATAKWADIPGFDPCISNCYIHGGVASFGCDVYVNNGGVKIVDCRIGARGKKSPYNYSAGALVFFEGASEGLIRNSLLVSDGNNVDRAIEVFNGFTTAGKALVVENCTFHGAKVIGSQNNNVASRFVTFKNCAFASTSFTSTALGDTMNMTFNSCAQLFASPVLTTFPGDGKSFYAADFRFNLTGNKDRDYYDLRGSSPLVNKGVNADWMVGATALNGEDRILGGTVDIGCFEYKACWSGLLLR